MRPSSHYSCANPSAAKLKINAPLSDGFCPRCPALRAEYCSSGNLSHDNNEPIQSFSEEINIHNNMYSSNFQVSYEQPRFRSLAKKQSLTYRKIQKKTV